MLTLTRKQGILYYFHSMFSMLIAEMEPNLKYKYEGCRHKYICVRVQKDWEESCAFGPLRLSLQWMIPKVFRY